MSIDIEIRSQSHLMDYDGSSNEMPNIDDVIKAVRDRGYEPISCDISFDGMFGFWRVNGDLKRCPSMDKSQN